MADRRHAEVPEVLGRQLGQACLIDRIFPECLPIAFRFGGKSGSWISGQTGPLGPNSDIGLGYLTPSVASVSLIAHAAAAVPGGPILPDHPKGLVRAVPSRTESC
jgi:hypothetical protein